MVREEAFDEILQGCSVVWGGGPTAAVRVARGRLKELGASGATGGAPAVRPGSLALADRRADSSASRVDLSWFAGGPPGETWGSEEMAQAVSGIAALHGSRVRSPSFVDIEVASIAAGHLAVNGLLAGLFGAARGAACETATSVLEAALLFTSHFVAFTSAEARAPETAPADPGAGVGLRSAEGHHLEIDALRPEQWAAFWARLGLSRAEAARGWNSFRLRFHSGSLCLDSSFYSAAARCSMAELIAAGKATGTSVVRVRYRPDPAGAATTRARRWDWAPGDAAPEGTPRSTRRDLPLRGVRVVDVTRLLQGPMAGFLLRSLGAEVVHVEPPGGELAYCASPREAGTFSSTYNRGKHLVVLDLKTPAGRRSLADLVGVCDILIHNAREDASSELGLDYPSTARQRPGLIHVHAGGWGESDAALPAIATDYLVQAHHGLGALLSRSTGAVTPSPLPVLDTMGGIMTCQAALAGLVHRSRTGRGARFSTSLAANARAWLAYAQSSPSTIARPSLEAVVGSLAEAGLRVPRYPEELGRLPLEPGLMRFFQKSHVDTWVARPPWSFERRGEDAARPALNTL